MSAETITSLARAEAIGLGTYNSGLSDQAVRQRFNVTHIARLAGNENPLGASPEVGRALNLSAPDSAIYPKPSIVKRLDRVRAPFSINRSAQAAALAALNDRRHVLRSVDHVRVQRSALRQALIAMGLTVAPSQANFLFFRVLGEGAAVAEKLLAHGIIVKPWLETGYQDWLRVSIGTEADQQLFLQALNEVLK